MLHRFLALILGLAPTSHAAEPESGLGSPAGARRTPEANRSVLIETEAVRRALARPAVAELWRGRAAAARATAVGRSVWQNPSLGYQRQQLLEGDADVEEQLTLSQRIDLSGKRGLRRDAGEHLAEAAELDGVRLQQQIAAETRTRFYEVVYRQERVRVLEDWLSRLEAARSVIARRRAGGEASAYEQHRLDREIARARADLAVARAERGAAWQSLTALVGKIPARQWPRVQSKLLPEASAAPRDSEIASRPDLRALELERDAARLNEDAASRAAIPELSLTAGWWGVRTAGERRNGFVAGVNLWLPIFDHGQAEERGAKARRQQAEARRRLALLEAQASSRAAWLRVRELSKTASTFRRKSSEAAVELIRTSEAGYRGGALGLLSLLDAFRSATDDQLRLLDLELEARRAFIDLHRATGRNLP